ncbi:ricin-type beta-trefoil lectin domain protein [Saccharothrix obliqua]|uniref:ricin-type beta-trefoil lectin domain protein n=1 Tax=Saccharothrix obliqua TaxID=2861747 RepID=UPI001C5D46F8|nr:ricin-type beta-trefoil lectin domain protein [Saccharothrix obliqua]MBW4717894.1 ricin-type beta-trefoil lectin domain protein [Saccharothrix obliqua]
MDRQRRLTTLVAVLALATTGAGTASARADGGVDSAGPAATGQDLLRDRQGRPLVYVEGADDGALARAVARVGGEVLASTPGRVKAALPAGRTGDVTASPGVREVRLPDRAVPMAVTSEGVAPAKLDLWAQEGKKGAGVKVGVIDVGFGGLTRAQRAGELPEVVLREDDCSDVSRQRTHGTSVAEVVHDVAPEATLHLVCVEDATGFAKAADWLRERGVQVVSAAIGFPGTTTGRGDGTGDPGSPVEVVRRSREAGLLWSVAAGNQARLHFGGPAADRDRDGWVEFGGTTENNGFPAPAGTSTTVALRWDAWPRTTEDLDLYVLRRNAPPTGDTDPNVIAKSTRAQRDTPGGLSPTEAVTFTGTGATAWIWVRNRNARFTTPFDLFVSGPTGQLQFSTPSGSVVEPATSPYALAVGATQPGSGRVQGYSGRGPTVDGRTKPDLTGYDQVSTSTDGGQGFQGTSAAAAHVAGAAAVLKSAHPELDAARLESELKSRARADRVDNDWGHGALSLGVPGVAPVAASAGYRPLAEPRRVHDRGYGPGEVVTLPLDVTGDTTAVVLNVTARADTETRVDVVPHSPDQIATKTSALWVRPGGGFTSVMTTTTLGADRAVRLRNHTGHAWIVVDVLGNFAKDATATYTAAPAAERVLDTRLVEGAEHRLRVRGAAGVPDTAIAAVIALTASEATHETWLSAYSRDDGPPSTLNLTRGDRRANTAVVAIASDGAVGLRNEKGAVTVAVDVVGWFGPGPGARYVALANPTRVVDTGTGTGVPARPVGPGETVDFALGGVWGVSGSATAAALTVTGADGRAGTDLSVAAVERGRTTAPQLPVGRRQDNTASLYAPLGASGRLSARNERGRAEVAVDLHGYFVGGTPVPSDPCALPRGETGFGALFDGREGVDLTGWQDAGDGRATVIGCELRTAVGTGVTWHSAVAAGADHTLRLDWKALSPEADSGVLVGFDHPAGRGDAPGARGLEVQIGPAGATGDLATGAIAGKRAPDLAAAKPPGEWNTYEITISWHEVTVVLNGHRVNRYTTTESHRTNSRSFVGLQHSPAGSVAFRDVRVRDNSATGAGPVEGPNGKCLDVANGNPADNAVFAYTCSGEGNRAQSWTLPGDGTARAFHKCLDVIGGGVAAGTQVRLYDCVPGDAQEWVFRRDDIVNTRSGRCLAATGDADRAPLTIEDCGGQRQTWWVKPRAAVTGELTAFGGKCLDVADGNPDGEAVIVYGCSGDFAQTWSVVDDGTVRAYGKCLDVTGGNTVPGTRVILYRCNNDGAQQWQHRPDGSLVNPPSQRCLTAAAPADRAGLTIEDCDGRTAQRWRTSAQAVSAGALIAVVAGETEAKCLDVANGRPEDGRVIAYQCNGDRAQQWTAPGDGTIRAYGRCLDVSNGAIDNGTPVILHPCNGDRAQDWTRRPGGQLVNPQSGRCLDASPAGMIIWDCHTGSNQRWSVVGRTT